MISSNTKAEISGIRGLQILWGVEHPISSPITWPLIRRSTFGPGKQVSWRCSFAACPLAGCLGLSLKVAGTGKAWEERGDFTNSGTVTGDQWKVQTVLWALYHQQGAFTNKNGGSNHSNGCVGLCRVICFKDQQRCELKNGLLLLLLLLETHNLGKGYPSVSRKSKTQYNIIPIGGLFPWATKGKLSVPRRSHQDGIWIQHPKTGVVWIICHWWTMYTPKMHKAIYFRHISTHKWIGGHLYPFVCLSRCPSSDPHPYTTIRWNKLRCGSQNAITDVDVHSVVQNHKPPETFTGNVGLLQSLNDRCFWQNGVLT